MNEKKIDAIKSSKPMKLLDIIVIALTIVVAIVLIFTVYPKSDKSYVEIKFQNKSKQYDLKVDRVVDLNCLKVVIENKTVYVLESNCNNKICMQSGKINRVNQIIACTPNNVIIKIVGKSQLNAETGQK